MNLRRVSLAWSLLVLTVIACDGRQPLGPSFAVVSTPAVLTATAVSFSQINLAWQDNSTTAGGFEVYRSTTGPSGTFALRGSTGAGVTSYSDGGLSGSSQYCYKVRAFKVSGANRSYSQFSSAACATTPARPIPSAPSATDALPSNSRTVEVRWTDNSANEDGFRIERSPDGVGSWATVTTTPGNVTSVQDGGRTSEQQVCYRVIAFNAGGDSPLSNTDCTTPPVAPTGLTATAVEGPAINLAWTDNSAVEDGYEVRRSTDAVQFSVVASLPANSATYSDRAVSGNVTYSYVVAAKRDGGFSDFSTVASARTGLVTRGGIVTWGNTMMKFSGSSAFRTLLGDDGGATDDYILARNMLQHLSGKTSNVRILYTDTCDPRTDPEVCHVGGLEYLQPFYDMIATIGTITYGDMASVQLADFDVLIADFCSLPSQEYDMLKSYLSSGGPAMVLADNFCVADEYSTAYLANTVMHDLGVTFSDYELIEYERFQIPNSDQVGLLTGVSNLSLWRLTPQFIIYDFVPVATWDGNVLYTIHEGTFARQVAAAARVTGKATTGRHRARGPAPPSTGPGPSLVGKLANGERVLARN